MVSTDILLKTTFKKKNEKNPACETVVWPLVDRVKNLIEKKWPGLSDNGMASGGLIHFRYQPLLIRKLRQIYQLTLDAAGQM